MVFIEFKRITENQVDQLALLHKKIIPYSVNAKAGIDHLRHLYNTFVTSRHVIGYVAIDEEKVVGIIICSKSFEIVSNETVSIRKELMRKFKSPLFIIKNFKNLIDYVLNKKAINSIKPTPYYIMLWFVDESYANRRIGHLLLEKLFADPLLGNVKAVAVDVRKSSKKAIKGYHRNGFENYRTTLFSRILLRKQN